MAGRKMHLFLFIEMWVFCYDQTARNDWRVTLSPLDWGQKFSVFVINLRTVSEKATRTSDFYSTLTISSYCPIGWSTSTPETARPGGMRSWTTGGGAARWWEGRGVDPASSNKRRRSPRRTDNYKEKSGSRKASAFHSRMCWEANKSVWKCGMCRGSTNTMRMVMVWTVTRIRKWMLI